MDIIEIKSLYTENMYDHMCIVTCKVCNFVYLSVHNGVPCQHAGMYQVLKKTIKRLQNREKKRNFPIRSLYRPVLDGINLIPGVLGGTGSVLPNVDLLLGIPPGIPCISHAYQAILYGIANLDYLYIYRQLVV